MTLTAVLLTGGLSRRMGMDKATLTTGGGPMWGRQLALLRTLRPEKIQVSARARPAWCPPEMEVLLDEPPSRGPLSGLVAALQLAQTSHLIALAIDLPEITPSMLDRLWQKAQPDCGIIPVNGNRYEPLCAVYPKQAAPLARAALTGTDWSLQHLAETLVRENLLQPCVLAEEEKPLFRNLNTPADL